MKTIEPNSNEDLISHYNAVNIEFLNVLKDPNGIEPSNYEKIIWGYQNLIRFLDRCIREKKLYN